MLNILMVFHAPPFPPDLGPSRRHYHELVELLERGHRVSVLSYGSGDDERRFRARFGARCASVRFVPLHASPLSKAVSRCWNLARLQSDFGRLRTRRLQRALDAMVAADRFDVISFSTTMLGGLRLPAGIPLLGDTHNIEFDTLRRAFEQTPRGLLREYFRIQAALTRREETAFARRFDVVCVTSQRDRRQLGAAVPEAQIEVVPNGVDLTEHRRDPSAVREPGCILFTGLMSYYPNVHGVRFFVEEILPRVAARVPRARLLVVGADPPPGLRALASERVVLTGFVPDVRPYLERAEVFVVPLRIGGGTRVKALQAMAMDVPIVSTTLGCEGLDLESGRHALMADDAESFAAAVVRLLESPALGTALARQAAEHVLRFEWSRVGDRLDQAFSRAARASRGRPAATLAYVSDPH